MTYPLVRAVTAPTLDAEVLFDFNDEGQWASDATAGALADGWTLGVPARLSGVGDPRSAWGPRKCQFAIRIQGPRASAVAAQSRLARWLLRADGWVMFQLDALSRPVWLRMLGADPGDLSFEQIFVDRDFDRWLLSCAFDAEPFMYGERVTLPAESLSQDVAGTPWFETPVIEGDAPSRLRLEVGGSTYGASYLLAGVPAAASTVSVWDCGSADGFASAADTSTPGDATSSGGSRRLVSFATDESLVTRFSGTAPVAVKAGLYRVLVRAKNSAIGSVVVTDLSIDGHRSDTVTWTEGLFQWQDFGVFQIPRGSVSLPGVDLPDVTPPVVFRAGRLSGSAQLSVDAILLVPVTLLEDPAEASALNWRGGPVAGGEDSVLVDGDYEVSRVLDGGAFASSASAGVQASGGWPEVVPGRVNTIVVLNLLAAIDNTNTVTASYMPRWLYLPSEAA